MGSEKKSGKPWRKVVKSGGYQVEVKEITKGRDTGKFQITGARNGKFYRYGVRTTQEKALEAAQNIVDKEDIRRTRINNLPADQLDLVCAFLDSGMTKEDLNTFQARTAKTNNKTLSDVLEIWYSSQTNLHEYSSYYLSDWKFVKTRLTAHLGAHRLFNTIDTTDLEGWLDSLKRQRTSEPISRKRYKNLRGVLVTIWKWAATQKRGFTSANFASHIEAPRILSRTGGHEVLTPQEFALLLGNVSNHHLPWLSISGFAGLRQSEICGASGRLKDRLKWEDFDWTHNRISVRPETSKTRLPRYVPICAALAEWLEPWRNARGFVHIGQRPSYSNKKQISETKRLGALIGGWKANALRASRASYRIAETNDISLTAQEDGHTEAMLRKNYLNPRFAEDAALWFALTPNKVKELNGERLIHLKKA